MTPPYAKLLCAKNGGSPSVGPITCVAGDVLQFSPQSSVGIGLYDYRFPAGAYPDGWPLPSGWVLAANGDIFFTDTSSLPPAITVPSVWGECLPVLTVNANQPSSNPNLVDATMMFESLSPLLGLYDTALGETAQADPVKTGGVGQLQKTLRVLEAIGATTRAVVDMNNANVVIPVAAIVSLKARNLSADRTATFPANPVDGALVFVRTDATTNGSTGHACVMTPGGGGQTVDGGSSVALKSAGSGTGRVGAVFEFSLAENDWGLAGYFGGN